MWTVIPHIYNVITAPHVNASIFKWTYLGCYWRNLDNWTRYTAKLVPNTEHIVQFTLCELWSPTYTMHLLFRIICLQYSAERTCAAIGDMPTFRCALYCKLGAKYSAHPPVYAMRAVVPDIYNVITVTHIQASILKWTCLRCNWRYPDNSMRAILQTRCQIQRTSSSLRYVDCGSGHI
jgi:hypothetical protein